MREHLEAISVSLATIEQYNLVVQISVCLTAIEGQLRDRKVTCTGSSTQWHRCQNIEELKEKEGWTTSQCDTFSLWPGVLSITLKQEMHPNPNLSYVAETPKMKTMQCKVPQLSAQTRTQLLFDMRPLVMFPNCHWPTWHVRGVSCGVCVVLGLLTSPCLSHGHATSHIGTVKGQNWRRIMGQNNGGWK